MESDPPATVAVHPATANNADVPSGGEMATTVGGGVSNTNKTGNREITSPTMHVANTTGGVETTMDTATNAGGTSAHTQPPDSLQIDFNTLKKLNRGSGANKTVQHVITSPAMYASETTSGMETNMETTTNAGGATISPLPPDSVTPQKQNDISTNKMCSSDTNRHTVSIK